MSDAAPATPQELDDDAAQRALALLVNVGTSIALELKKPGNDVTVTDRANAFERVALAVRRTIILSRHITQTRETPVRADTKRALIRRQIIREVEETIETKSKPADAGALRIELLERVDAPEFDADITHRAPADLIRELCCDLGLANVPGLRRFPRRTPDDIAILCAQAAAAPGSNLPQWIFAKPAPTDPAAEIRRKER